MTMSRNEGKLAVMAYIIVLVQCIGSSTSFQTGQVHQTLKSSQSSFLPNNYVLCHGIIPSIKKKKHYPSRNNGGDVNYHRCLLFSSRTISDDENNAEGTNIRSNDGGDETSLSSDSPPGGGSSLERSYRILTLLFRKFNKRRLAMIASYRKFLQNARVKLMTTLLIQTLLWGFMAKEIASSSVFHNSCHAVTEPIMKLIPGHVPTAPTPKAAVPAKPIEIPYSEFMDFCEGKHANRNQRIENVQIESVSVGAPGSSGGFNKISFDIVNKEDQATSAAAANARKFYSSFVERMNQQMDEFKLGNVGDEIDDERIAIAATKGAALSDANGGTMDASTEESKGPAKKLAYTHSLEGTNAELIHFLRKNKIPFQAMTSNMGTLSSASSTSGTSLANLAFAGVILYLYKNGGFSALGPLKQLMVKKNGKGGNNSIRNRSTTSFDDIEGIDEAKNDVLELVDTLRNPEKYSLVGARAPTGLLLEGPPGTGKVGALRGTWSMTWNLSLSIHHAFFEILKNFLADYLGPCRSIHGRCTLHLVQWIGICRKVCRTRCRTCSQIVREGRKDQWAVYDFYR